MGFLDDVSSEMSLEAVERIYRCDECGEVFRISPRLVEVTLERGYFLCAPCERKRSTTDDDARRQGKADQRNRLGTR
jgi:formylmethanofuran dehydrogenase subunit E